MLNVKVKADGSGTATVTDGAGNTLDWVHVIYVSIEPGVPSVLFLGSLNFTADIAAFTGAAPAPAAPTGPAAPGAPSAVV
jgi:hypothetical protein